MAGLREVTDKNVPVEEEIVFRQANKIRNFLVNNPTKTLSDVANYLKVEPEWVERELSLFSITNPAVKRAIVGLNMSNIYNLAKLPSQEQVDYIIPAKTMSSAAFCDLVQSRLREIT